ncbi:hypothetical protein [Tenacibaculum amylolyticum]|uniref:hypothetical protein n=1 Tax=Tenacibaculum amylolyticum TaxID=104269 RepID=UPI003894587E
MKTRKKTISTHFLIYTVSLFVFVSFTSCNWVSFRSMRNDFRWKNKKFATPINATLTYSPHFINQVKSKSVFFKETGDYSLKRIYKVKKILVEKLEKRNILLNSSSNDVKIRIDTVLFKGYSESVEVSGLNESLGHSDRDFFIFKIAGSILLKDSLYTKISTTINHNTEPRESHFFTGFVAHDGINADPKVMVQNAINEFSYRTYEKLEEILKEKSGVKNID